MMGVEKIETYHSESYYHMKTSHTVLYSELLMILI